MTSTDLVRQPVQTNVLTAQQLKYIAHTEFVPVGLRGKEPAILACVATGRALGIDDMTALRSIHIIDGKATFSAELMVQLVRRRGHSIQGNFSGDSCTVNGKRADNGDEMTVTWTKQMAQEAGLLGKNNWKKYGASMLWARAVSQLARMLFADCFAGATYTEDEIGEAEYAEIPDSAGGPQTEETAVSTVQAAPTPPEGDQPSPAETPSAAHSFLDAEDLAVIALEDAPTPTAGQIKKLNVLVGTLRDAGRVTTEDVWAAVGREAVASEDGVLHWSPLRDTLTKPEASALIEWLTELEANGGMTMNALIKHVGDAQVDPTEIRAAIGRLFPGRGRASELTDVERGVLWGEVSGG